MQDYICSYQKQTPLDLCLFTIGKLVITSQFEHAQTENHVALTAIQAIQVSTWTCTANPGSAGMQLPDVSSTKKGLLH